MNYKLVCTLEKVFEKAEFACICIMAPIPLLLYSPVYFLKKAKEWYKDRKKSQLLDKSVITPDVIKELDCDDKERLIKEGRIVISELPHTLHSESDSGNLYLCLFHKERKLVLDFQTIAYVENEYCERMHRFFEEQREWIKEFEEWHAWKIEFIDSMTVKEGMLFSKDFDNHMNHGFLWNTYTSSGDHEYGFVGDRHLYFDINLATDDEIKQQMHLFMSAIYSSFQWHLI